MEDIIRREIRRIVKEELREFKKALDAKPAPPPSKPAPPPKPTPQPPQILTHNCTCQEGIWTTQRTAEFLGLKLQTIYNRVAQQMPGFPMPRKHGRINAFNPDEVIAYQRRLLGLDES